MRRQSAFSLQELPKDSQPICMCVFSPGLVNTYAEESCSLLSAFQEPCWGRRLAGLSICTDFYLVPFFSYASSLLTVTNTPGSRSPVVQPHPRLTSSFGWRRHRSLTVDLREDLQVLKCLNEVFFFPPTLLPYFHLQSQYFHSQAFSGPTMPVGLLFIGSLSTRFRLGLQLSLTC